mgnify:FL=1
MRKGMVGVVLLLAAAAARAENSSGSEVMAAMDAAMTRADSQFMEYEAIVEQNGTKKRSMRFRVTVKGEKRRRVDFVAPGDVKGMKILMLSPEQMYVYMPAYRKVRRVASHVKEQGFMGSSYTQDEMAIVRFGDFFDAKLIEETEKQWILAATLRSGREFPFPRLEIEVRKDVQQPSEVRFYNAEGQKIKTELRREYTCKGKICNPRRLVMTDHSRGELKTPLRRRLWKVNVGAPDSYFSLRALQRR